MEAFFDNKNNVLTANICSSVDNATLYTLKTTFSFRGRRLTIMKDANPALGNPTTVGALHWDEGLIEILGVKKKFSDVKRHEGNFLKKRRLWKWSTERKEYAVKYEDDDWKARNSNDEVVGIFSVPYRPHLFSKPKPTILTLSREALEKDEVFLILIFIYSEAKRQDQTNSSVGAGSEGY